MPRQRNIRILHIMSSHGGGISTFIHNIAREIQSYGIIFDVVTFGPCPDDFIQTIRRTGGDVYQIKNPKKDGWRQFKQSFKRILQLYSYQLVHCHIAGYRALAYKFLVNRYSRANFIIHAHHYVDEKRLNPVQKLLHYVNQQINQSISSRYVGCSRQAVESLFGYQIKREEILVIPNSISIEDYLYSSEAYQRLRAEKRQELGIAPQELVVAQIGRLEPVKNHQLTLDVAALARSKGLNMRFLLLGAGSLARELELKVTSLRLGESVKMLGRLSPIANYLPLIDCVIFPSFSEGLGTAAIESQAAGIPVVMSDVIPIEVELGLNLTKRLKLSQEAGEWLQAIIESQSSQRPDTSQRRLALEKHHYSNEQAAKLYASMIAGKTIKK